jgi:receptor protein-tyrosine kinase
MGKRVLAVSADLHNPSLHEYFAEAPTEPVLRSAGPVDTTNPPAGLVQVLSDEVPLSEAVRRIALTGAERIAGGSLDLLADRRTFFDPAVLFTSAAMQNFLKQAKRQYDIIVFDTPPLLANADASLLAQESDVIVLAARLDQLTKNQARRAHAVMTTARLTATGVIVTGSPEEPEYGYGYRYGYDYKGDPSVPSDEAARSGASA